MTDEIQTDDDTIEDFQHMTEGLAQGIQTVLDAFDSDVEYVLCVRSTEIGTTGLMMNTAEDSALEITMAVGKKLHDSIEGRVEIPEIVLSH